MAYNLGDWSWYCGSCESDDEMMRCGTREEAIQFGRKEMDGDGFFIIEALLLERHEREIANNERDTAPFDRVRNGERVEPLKVVE